MGQYHLIVNLDKREYLEPYAFGEYSKLMEFGNESQGTLTALAVLLARDNGKGAGDLFPPLDSEDVELIGSWAGDRIVVTGDYGEPGANIDPSETSLFALTVEGLRFAAQYPDRLPNLYNVARGLYANVSDRVIRLLRLAEGINTKLRHIDLNETVRSRIAMVSSGQQVEVDEQQQIMRLEQRELVLEEFSRMTVERIAELLQQRARNR
jgi:hypothetical protein